MSGTEKLLGINMISDGFFFVVFLLVCVFVQVQCSISSMSVRVVVDFQLISGLGLEVWGAERRVNRLWTGD
jgi:hypothetical protein